MEDGGLLWKLVAASTQRGCRSSSWGRLVDVDERFHFHQQWKFPRTCVEVSLLPNVTLMKLNSGFHGSKFTSIEDGTW